jgi:hypothetical protein
MTGLVVVSDDVVVDSFITPSAVNRVRASQEKRTISMS